MKGKVPEGIELDRSCTDIICLFLFIVFLGTMLASLGYGIKKGNLGKYTSPIDKDDRFCGHMVTNSSSNAGAYDYRDYPVLFLEDLSYPTSDIFKLGYCVDKCPSSTNETIRCAPGGYY